MPNRIGTVMYGPFTAALKSQSVAIQASIDHDSSLRLIWINHGRSHNGDKVIQIMFEVTDTLRTQEAATTFCQSKQCRRRSEAEWEVEIDTMIVHSTHSTGGASHQDGQDTDGRRASGRL